MTTQTTTIPVERLRSILLGPDGEQMPQISRVSWLRSMVEVSEELAETVEDCVAAVELEDPDAHGVMISEVRALLSDLESLLRETA